MKIVIPTQRVYHSKTCTHIATEIDPREVWPVPECGAPVIPGRNYCQGHYDRMHRPGKVIKIERKLLEDTSIQIAEDPELVE